MYFLPLSVISHSDCFSSGFRASPAFPKSQRVSPVSRGDTPIAMPISAGLLGSVILDSASRTLSVLGFSSAILLLLKSPSFSRSA